MKLQARLGLVIALAVVGLALAAILLQQHHGAGDAAGRLCGDAPGAGCDVVNRSSWSEVGGVPLAALGLVLYGSLLALAVMGLLAEAGTATALAGLGFVAAGAALLVDAALLGVQGLAIGEWCTLCLTTYALNAGVFALLWPERRAAAAAAALPDSPGGRLALGGWGLGTVAASLAAAALSLGFAAQGELQQATLLGAPLSTSAAPAPDPPDAGAGEAAAAADDEPAEETEAPPADPAEAAERYRQQAQAAQREVARLEEILADPQKLEEYRSDEASRAFASSRVAEIDLSTTSFKGPSDAPVRAVTYSDFLCPYCRNLAGALAGYLPQSGGRVAIYYKHYPLDPACNDQVQGGHPGACLLAMGGICAEAQNRFWPYHDKVFQADLHSPTPSEVTALAGTAGLDPGAFEKCLEDPATKRRVDADIAEAQRLGVNSTPTVYINGKHLPRINDFVRIVDEESRRLGVPVPESPAR